MHPGASQESPPDSGEAEDTIFFHKHLDIHAEENKRRGKFPILRASGGGCYQEEPLLYYRWTETSGTSQGSGDLKTFRFEGFHF